MKTIILFFCLLGSNSFFAIDLSNYFNTSEKREVYVVKDEYSIGKIVIPFHFNTSKTDFDFKKLVKISPRSIRTITYTYADNKSKYEQEGLNKRRFDTLSKSFKQRLRKSVDQIQFETFLQTKETDRRKLFTGFIISYEKRSKITSESFKADFTSNVKPQNPDGPIFEIDTLAQYGYFLYRFHPNLASPEYSIISNKLNKLNEFKGKLIVADITGSMYPYAYQLMLWLKLNYEKDKSQKFVFFNDGDDNIKSRIKKEIGATGGIYTNENKRGFDDVLETISKGITNGSGGWDIEENDLEAILKGLQKFKTIENIILIADNNAPPRDFELWHNISKPVRVILCGIRNNLVQQKYIDLAFKTKGSIHSMEKDLYFSIESQEGKIIEFLGQKYKVTNGKLKQIETI